MGKHEKPESDDQVTGDAQPPSGTPAPPKPAAIARTT